MIGIAGITADGYIKQLAEIAKQESVSPEDVRVVMFFDN